MQNSSICTVFNHQFILKYEACFPILDLEYTSNRYYGFV